MILALEASEDCRMMLPVLDLLSLVKVAVLTVVNLCNMCLVESCEEFAESVGCC